MQRQNQCCEGIITTNFILNIIVISEPFLVATCKQETKKHPQNSEPQKIENPNYKSKNWLDSNPYIIQLRQNVLPRVC